MGGSSDQHDSAIGHLGGEMTEEKFEVVTSTIKGVCEETPLEIEHTDFVEEEETGEAFIDFIVSFPKESIDEDITTTIIRPFFQAYARLVNDAGLEYPLEVISGFRMPPAEGVVKVSGFRISVMWAREHANENLTLGQILYIVYRTLQSPDNPEEALYWLPSYDADWRGITPDDADELPGSVYYDHWAGKETTLPEGESNV